MLDCNDPPSEITLISSLAASENGSYTIKIPENSPSGISLVNTSVVDDNVGQQRLCAWDGRELLLCYIIVQIVFRSLSVARRRFGL